MTRTNSFTIKLFLTTSLLIISIFCFYTSYSEFEKISNKHTSLFTDIDINYFDKEKFQKYYEVINIENLSDQVFDIEIEKENIKDFSDTIKDKIITEEVTGNEVVNNLNEIRVSKGDNFAKILKKGGLKGRDIDLVILNGEDYYDFSKLYI